MIVYIQKLRNLISETKVVYVRAMKASRPSASRSLVSEERAFISSEKFILIENKVL